MRACSVISTTTRAPSLSAISRRNPGADSVAGETLTDRKMFSGSDGRATSAARTAASSSSRNSPTSSASANQRTGPRCRRTAETRQRLCADGRAGQRADRLEHGMQDIRVQRVADALLAPPRAILGAPASVQQAGELLDHATGHLDREAALPVRRTLDRAQDGLARAALDEIAVGARLQHLEHRLTVALRRQYEHARARRATLDPARRLRLRRPGCARRARPPPASRASTP